MNATMNYSYTEQDLNHEFRENLRNPLTEVRQSV
jgi:hypothetical protein